MRFLFYSHDGVGLGHVRRHLAISAALTEAAPGSQVLLATSVDEVSNLGLPPNVDTLKLPGLRKLANNQYGPRRLKVSMDEIRMLRAKVLEAAVESFRPAVVLADKHPFGAAGEFRPALETAREKGSRTVLGFRDILDAPDSVMNEWANENLPESIADWYDLVLVYGERNLFDLSEEYQFSSNLISRTKYCGYVLNQGNGLWPASPSSHSLIEPDSRRTVLATAGGGEDGFALLQTFIRATEGSPWKGVVVTGPLLDQSKSKRLHQLGAEYDVKVHTFLPCLSRFFGSVDALVCMGGYNTLVEAISAGVPTVCVPRAVPRAEQLLRARTFSARGLLRTIHPDDLTAQSLRCELASALATPRSDLLTRTRQSIAVDGAKRAASHLLELLATVKRTEAGQLVRCSG
jgi:predicted glycosyltransferase